MWDPSSPSRLVCLRATSGKIARRITGVLQAALYFSNNSDYSRLIYHVAFSILAQYRFHSGADLESGDVDPFVPSRRDLYRSALRPSVHCSIMQCRLNPSAALRPDFKGDTFPDGRWSWRPPITSVSKAWRVTYRTRNRSARTSRDPSRAVVGYKGDERRTGILGPHPRPATDSVHESERPRDRCWLFLFEICDTRLAKIVA